MTQFTERQRKRLLTALAEVDRLLHEVTCTLDRAARRSPFARDIPDATPIQQQLAVEYAAQIRDTLRSILQRHRLDAPQPGVSSLQSARTAVDRAIVATEEVGPRYMASCGAVPDEMRADLNRAVSSLLALLDHLRVHLASPSPAALAARAEASDRAAPDDRRLRTLMRVIATQELTAFVPAAEALVERYESADLEVAVFGRVNAGKSSLLNELLGTKVLPVGATPVTAVPIVVAYGAQAWGFAAFADAAPEKFSLDRLPEFCAEHFNPGNRRHVTSLRVELPAPRLRDGLTLVDVPGTSFERLGDVATTAAPAARCDVGLVLIDAAAGLTLEEGKVVHALLRAGARVLVLVTKADQLGDDERWRIHGHVWHGLTAMVGTELPVYLASTVATSALLRDEWIRQGLEPLLHARTSVRTASLRRKLGVLQDAVRRDLERQLSLEVPLDPRGDRWQAATEELANVRAAIEAERSRAFEPPLVANEQTAALIDEVAFNASVLWSHGDGTALDITTLVADSMLARCASTAGEVAKALAKLEARCRIALARAGALVGMARADLGHVPHARVMPVLRDAAPIANVVLPHARLAFLGRGWRRRTARRWLRRSPVKGRVVDVTTRYLMRVGDWRAQALRALLDELMEQAQAIHARRADALRRITGMPSGQARAIITALRDLDEVSDHAD